MPLPCLCAFNRIMSELQNLPPFDWNDLKYFLAVAQAGSTTMAARNLGVSQTTVQRRLSELETALGHRLLRREKAGYRLTDLGSAVLDHASAVGAAIDGFGQAVDELAREHGGVIRVTCPEPIVMRLIESGFIDRFNALHPDLTVEFVMSDRYVDLVAGEADIALRSGDTDDNDLVGRKIADSFWAVYASKRYVAAHGKPTNVSELALHPLIGFDAKISGHRASKWLQAIAPDAHYAARSNSVLGLIHSARSGLGLAALPVPLGDAEDDLVRVLEPIPELTRAWRILTHPDLRKTRRVTAFFDFVQSEFEFLKPILTG